MDELADNQSSETLQRRGSWLVKLNQIIKKLELEVFFAIEVERLVSLREILVDCDRFQENQRWEVT